MTIDRSIGTGARSLGGRADAAPRRDDTGWSVSQSFITLDQRRDFRRIDLDAPIRWGCSLKGWNCCVDKAVFVRPHDAIRLRHSVSAPSQDVVDRVLRLIWNTENGALTGLLRHGEAVQGREPCIFLDEITNTSARVMREEDPDRFATMPGTVKRAANSDRAEWVVAGLCRAHLNRPEVCRGFPFQRFVEPQADATFAITVRETHRCGTCALATPTTPREIFKEDGVIEYWRALDAGWQVERYLVAAGAANIEHRDYTRLPTEEAAAIWHALYLADGIDAVAQRFPEQWRSPLDIEGDGEIFRIVLEHVLDRVDDLVQRSEIGSDELGVQGQSFPRPDLATLLDPARSVFAPPPVPAR